MHGGARVLDARLLLEIGLGGGERFVAWIGAVEERRVLAEIGVLRAKYETRAQIGATLPLPLQVGHVGQLHPASERYGELSAVQVVPGAARASRLADAHVINLLERLVAPRETRGRVGARVPVRILELVVEKSDGVARASLESVAQVFEILLDEGRASVDFIVAELETHL